MTVGSQTRREFSTYSLLPESKVIDIKQVKRSPRQLPAGLLKPAIDAVSIEDHTDRKGEAIKDINVINQISKHLIDNGRYRDNALFIVGINFGLRVSDLRLLKFCHLIDEDLCFKHTFPILEKKTSKTRKVKRYRFITINNAVMEAVTLYLEHSTFRDIHLDDYLFPNLSNNGSGKNEPLTRQGIDYLLKKIVNEELGLKLKIATHSLRKTFGYHQMAMSGNDPRKLLLLQKMFGHSSVAQTLDYIGITNEEIEDAYLNLNLGSYENYLDSCVGEDSIDESESNSEYVS